MQGVDIPYTAELLLSARRKLFQMLHEIRVELLFILDMLRHRAAEHTVVRIGEAVNGIVDKRTERKPLPQGVYTAV